MKIEEIDNEIIREAVVAAMLKRKEAKPLEEKAQAMKTDANNALLVLFDQVGTDKFEADDIGSATKSRTVRSHVDMDKLKEYLVQKGVKVNILEKAIEKATGLTEVFSIRFTPCKSEGIRQ